jgi:hypothetical protein
VPINQKHIDPTYLRTIVDGLNSGALQKDNPSALPQGLVGMYEEVLPPASNVHERKKFLKFFLVWALLKKEVSSAFVAELLNESEEEVLSFILSYSTWFNSSVSGKYQLYHERLRVFLLQRSSKRSIELINLRLILVLNDAIKMKSGNELELYALQFLTDHLLISALMNNGDSRINLVQIASDEDFLNRQVMISNGFNWSKATNTCALYILSYENELLNLNNRNLLIELGMRRVDMYYAEQNDAPVIIRLVSEGKLDLALQRIESFGGKSQRDQQRRFVLITLGIIELAYSNKNAAETAEQIRQLCKILIAQETIAIDTAVCLPHKVIFNLACRLEQMGIDYSPITSKIGNWNFNWIQSYSDFNDLSICVLMNLLTNLHEPICKNAGLSKFALRLCEMAEFDLAFGALELITEDIQDDELPF